MLYEEFQVLSCREQNDFIKSIDASTSEGRKNANDVITSYPYYKVIELIENVPTLTEDDLVIIFQRFSTENNSHRNMAEAFVAHSSFTLSVLKRIMSEKKVGCLRNNIFVSAAKSTEDEDIYNILYFLGKKSILNACKKNQHFVVHEQEDLREEVKALLFILEYGNISEDTGIEMIDKFKLPASIIKTMLRMNPKWREHILVSKKLDFGNVDDQLMIAKDDETDVETLYELSLVAKNNAVRKAILDHHNCTLDMARNMFN